MKNYVRFTSVICAVALTSIAMAQDYHLGKLKIHHPRVRAMFAGAKVGGGYLTIHNSGPENDRLIGVTSALSESIQLHEMSMEGDVMKMRPLEKGLEIAKGTVIELKPGAIHLMFMGVAKPFKEGDLVAATLTFEKSGSIDIMFSVERQ